MSKSIRVYTKKNRAAASGIMVGVRIQPELLAAVDNWAASEDDVPSRPEAVRRLIVRGLGT